MQKLLYLVVLLLTIGASSHSQEVEYDTLAGFKYFETTRNTEGYKGKLPLLVAFHYSSSSPTETVADYDSLKTPVRIIIPVGNHRKREGSSYYPVNYYKEDSLKQVALSKKTVDSLAAFVEAISKKYDARPIVSGISQGGDIALLLAVYYPQLIRASFPFAGFIHAQLYDEINKRAPNKVPVYLYQGEDDPIIAVSYTRHEVKILGAKLNLRLFTYPGVRHDISLQMKKDYSTLINEILNH